MGMEANGVSVAVGFRAPGFAKPSASIAIAAVLIAGGGLIAARDMIRKKS